MAYRLRLQKYSVSHDDNLDELNVANIFLFNHLLILRYREATKTARNSLLGAPIRQINRTQICRTLAEIDEC